MRVGQRVDGRPRAASSASGDHAIGVRPPPRAFSVGQISTSPAWPTRCATWRMRPAAAVTTGCPRRIGKHVDRRRQQRRHRPERQGQRNALPRQSGVPWPPLRSARPCRANMLGRARPESCRSTASRRRPRRGCAGASRAPRTGEELLGQRADHLPLHRARVLRLVDQDVVEPPSSLNSTHAAASRVAEQVGGLAR